MHIKLTTAIRSDYWNEVQHEVPPGTLFPEIEDGDFVSGQHDSFSGQINEAETFSRTLLVGAVDYSETEQTVVVKSLPVLVDGNGEYWIDREEYYAL